MHVVAVLQYYTTDRHSDTCRHQDILTRLPSAWKITVLTSGAYLDEEDVRWHADHHPNIRLVVAPIAYRNEMGRLGRLWAFLRFMWFVMRYRTSAPVDHVLASSTPLTVGWLGRYLSRKWDVPWTFEVRDLWPDFPIQMGMIPLASVQRWLYRLERSLYASATNIIALSPGQARAVAQRTTTPVTMCYQGTLWARRAQGVSRRERFSVLYAGMLGRANGVDRLLGLVHELEQQEDVELFIAGQGWGAGRISAACASSQQSHFLGSLPRRELSPWFARVHASLVLFEQLPVLGTNAPAKFFDSLAHGTPVLIVNDGWMREETVREGAGWYVPPEASLFAQVMRISDDRADWQARSEAAAAWADREFKREGHVAVYQQALEVGRP